MRAATAARSLSVSGRPKMIRELRRPMMIAHRGGGSTGIGPYPENTPQLMQNVIADGSKIVNYDGNTLLGDGVTLAGLHDTSVDRTIAGTGLTASMSVAAYKALYLDPVKSWGPGYPQNTWHAPLWTDIMDAIGASAAHAPECGVAGSQAYAIAAIQARGLQDYVQIESGALATVQAAVAAGIGGVWIINTLTLAQVQASWPPSMGPIAFDYYLASPEGGSAAAHIQLFIQAGYRVQVFSINRKTDALAAIAAAAAVGGVLDGVISNDPIYQDPNYVPRKTDSYATGRMGHGFVWGSGGSVPRGGFAGTKRFGWPNSVTTQTSSAQYLLGEISPTPALHTLTLDLTVEALTNSATASMWGNLGASSDYNAGSALRNDGGYVWALVRDGTLKIQRANNLSTLATSSTGNVPLVNPLRLSAPLAAGTPITALPTVATTLAIPAGTVFSLPTDQKVTTTAATTVGATSIPVASVTPTAAVAAGTQLPQTVTIQYTYTATQVILRRLDTGQTITATDSVSARTPGYVFVGKSSAAASSFTDGVVNSGSPVLTSATAAFDPTYDLSKVVTGTGIPAGTTVLSVDSPTQVTLSAPATASSAALTFTLARGMLALTWSNVTVS